MSDLIFFGELPPKTVHGVSLSNKINLNILKSKFKIKIIEEFVPMSEHGMVSPRKFYFFIISFISFFVSIVRKRYEVFYGVIYLSFMGILKNLLLVLVIKVFNRNVKIVLHFHRGDFVNFIKMRRNYVAFNLVDRFVDRYIVLSDSQKLLLKTWSLKSIFILPNTIDYELQNQVSMRCSNSESREYLSIIYVGNFIREKGLLEAIRAVKTINSLNNEFTVIFNAYGSHTSEIFKLELSEELKDCDFINLLSPVFGKDKMLKIADSNLAILPSYNEGLPLFLLECLQVGTPIIVTNVGYISDVLGLDYDLYCEKKSTQSIVNCILKIDDRFNEKWNSNILMNKYKKYSQAAHRIELMKIFYDY